MRGPSDACCSGGLGEEAGKEAPPEGGQLWVKTVWTWGSPRG